MIVFNIALYACLAVTNLTLVANLGLVFFLFIIGLEVDLRIMFRNARIASTVSIASMVLPFGLGCAIGIGVYNTFAAGAAGPHLGIFILF